MQLSRMLALRVKLVSLNLCQTNNHGLKITGEIMLAVLKKNLVCSPCQKYFNHSWSYICGSVKCKFGNHMRYLDFLWLAAYVLSDFLFYRTWLQPYCHFTAYSKIHTICSKHMQRLPLLRPAVRMV